ncbi:phage terminase large subunit [Xenorhabdus sp. KJ12.1]|uniref:phage terminase large subunit n=1 Tax=Xenorhabdus sp. KJ12.1 TaxID=1851571 RepID=UPI000C045F39|nr:phage terminase large subunit [Xenorhabdus sp. KJ12.1]PHM69480.1 terminase [Xenorhabdus sp. KJ12.1]
MAQSNGGLQLVQLHKGQMSVFKSPHRFKVVCAGRRWGKSRLSISKLMKEAIKSPKQRVWYIAPTYQMARQILWDDLQELIPRKWVKKKNDTTMTIVLKNGSELALKGADKPDTLRGVALHFVVLDEFQDMKPDTWYKVIRPTLSSTKGKALIIGTPKGYSAFHKLWTIGQNKSMQNKGHWKSWQFVTADSPFVPDSEIEAAREDMDPKSFAQEYLASFENMSGRVYYPFVRSTHVKPCEFNPKLPIWIGQDFNIDPMSSVVLQPQPNGELWAVDEIVLFSSNTVEVCDEIERRYWRWKNQVVIFPDPAGSYRQHARGESDIDIFKEKGFTRIDFPKKHPPIADRVNATNRLLMSAAGTVRLYIDPKCKHLIESFEKVIYKPGSRDIDKAASIEHSTDAIGYPIHRRFPVKERTILGGSR